jgi:hypothetical protein
MEMTLTELARFTKIGSVVAVGLLLLALVVPSSFHRLQEIFFPPRLPPPEVAFGKLPSLGIPNLPLKEGVTPEFILDTKTGRLPKNLPDRLKVYKITPTAPSPLVGERAKELAAKLGFRGDPQRLSSSEYRWEDDKKNRSLNVNIITSHFSLETDIKSLTSLTAGSSPTKASAVERVRNFLQNLGLLSGDYAEGRQETAYLKVEGETLRKVEDLSEAQLTRVDLFRQIEGQPILAPKPYEGLISVILSEVDNPFVVFHHWPLDAEQGSTYPLKIPAQVWKELEEGEAKIVFLGPLKGDPYASYAPLDPETIYIREIYLAYFDSEKLQNFLQPVYVLEGLGVTSQKQQLKYIAYIPAVSGEWVEEPTP